MPRKLQNINGLKFNNLFTLCNSPNKGNRYILCVCDCGSFVNVQRAHLKAGRLKSCGCTRVIHGMYRSPTYVSWNAMLQRCLNPKNSNYKKYGYRGIKVCDRWNPNNGGSFENFWSDMGTRPDGTTLNRINDSGIYSKETCRWDTIAVQNYDKPPRKDNRTGMRGVRFRKDRGVFESRISINGEQKLLYYGDNLEEAIACRLEAEEKFYPNI